MSEENTTAKPNPRKPRTRWIVMGIADALVLAIAGTTWSTVSYSKRGWDGDRLEHFVAWKTDYMLDQVEASDDQRTKVQAIVASALTDMEEFRDLKREDRQGLIAALTDETIDRDALEGLRLRKIEAVDRMSQRMLTAIADAAEVLTPAQRKELAEEWTRRWRDSRD